MFYIFGLIVHEENVYHPSWSKGGRRSDFPSLNFKQYIKGLPQGEDKNFCNLYHFVKYLIQKLACLENEVKYSNGNWHRVSKGGKANLSINKLSGYK